MVYREEEKEKDWSYVQEMSAPVTESLYKVCSTSDLILYHAHTESFLGILFIYLSTMIY